MRILLVLVACAAMGCGGQGATIAADAGVASIQNCGPVPEQPEIPLVVSTTDENGNPIVQVQRSDFMQLVNYETVMRTWTRCVVSH